MELTEDIKILTDSMEMQHLGKVTKLHFRSRSTNLDFMGHANLFWKQPHRHT